MFKIFNIMLILTGLLIGLAWPVTAAPPPQRPSDQQLIDQLKQGTQNKVRISYHADTGKVNFIGTDLTHPILQPGLLPANADPEAAARGFLAQYGQLFGLKDQASELRVMKETTRPDSRAFVRFQQRYQGIPIVGGEVIVQADAQQNIISANGELLPDLKLNITPTITAEIARQTALMKVAKEYSLTVEQLTAAEPDLRIYNPVLLGGPGRPVSTLVWRTEVTPLELLPIKEFVLIDAHLGVVALNFNQIDTALNRLTYDANNNIILPGTLRCDETNPTCSGGDAHEVAAHIYAGHTYNFYLNNHGRDSIDNAGVPLISTVHYGTSYVNAFWNGTQMVYGDGAGFPLADDVVGHELTHGVTQYESHLFYYYQSGAINESFSDVWGEFIDLTNGAGNDAASVRWQLGEDISGLGAIRNMQNPPAFSDPDRMLSSSYICDAFDQGGVHSNSGVNNKAVFLMTDGGTFNGFTVTGLGISKVAGLYYEVQTNLLTSGSNYQDLYNALIQAAINLGYSAADRQEIQNALNAVQMNQRPCGDPPAVALCPADQSPTPLFFDNLENIASGNWTSGAITGANEWYYPQTANPYGLDATYASSGVYNLWGYDRPAIGNYFIRMNSDITLPANAFLHFKHDWNFEAAYDGGVVEYSTNGGSAWNDAGSLFTDNGYNGTINSSFGNPLGGRSAFTYESRGYTASRLNLGSLAGQNVRFRFRIGTDSSVEDYGWFIDDVHIYTCPSSAPLPPDNLTATPVLQTLINLAWTDNSNNESGFKIERSPDGAGGWTQIATVGANITTYADAGLACNTPYWYRIRAFNANGDSPNSDPADATTLRCGSLGWKILFDETHGYGFDSPGSYIIEDALLDLATLLINAGATVDSLTPPSAFNDAAISQYDVLVLVIPQSNYSAQERATIKTFVQNGGRLVVVGEWGGWPPADTSRSILNAILSSVGTGITFNDNLVHDPTNNDASISFWPVIHQFLAAPVNQGVSQVVEYAGASLTVSNPGYVTAWADNDSYTTLISLSTVEQDATGLSVSALVPLGSIEGQFIVDGILSDTPPPPIPQTASDQSQVQAEIAPQALTVINFDDLPQPCLFSQTVALRNQYRALGVTFNGPGSNDGGAILNQCGNFAVNGHTAPNFLAFNSSTTLLNGGRSRTPEQIIFTQPVSFVQIKAGSYHSSEQPITLQAFDASNNLLGTRTIILNATLQPLNISTNGIVRVVISSPASTFVLDDLTFNTQSSGGPIPVMAMANVGSGNVFVISDINLWDNNDADEDSTTDLNEYNNSALALNVFLGKSGAPPIFLPIILRNAK